MDGSQYQREAMKTRHERNSQVDAVVFSTMEMASEVGEVANLVYKHVWQGHPLDTNAVILELGDVLWGIASLCDALGTSLDEVMTANIAKLRKRYPNGFTTADSLARVDSHADPDPDPDPACVLQLTWESLLPA